MASAGRILIMPKGAYDSSTTYDMLDMVKYNGTSWLAKKTVTGIEPSDTNSDYWHNLFDFDPTNIETEIDNLKSSLTQTRTDLDNRTNARLFFNWDDGGALQLFVDNEYYGTVAFVDKP